MYQKKIIYNIILQKKIKTKIYFQRRHPNLLSLGKKYNLQFLLIYKTNLAIF